MVVIAVPPSIRLRQVENWSLSTATTTAGPGLDGRQQYISRENRVWKCRYMVLDAWNKRASWGEYLAFIDQLRGVANTFMISIPNINAAVTPIGSPLFVFDAGKEAFVSGTNNAVVLDEDPNPIVASTAPAGSSVINLSGLDGEFLAIGAHFSYQGYAYRVVTNASGVVGFVPPLRKQIPAAAVLNVFSPIIKVRLASDEAAAAAYQFAGMLQPYYLDVVEAFD